MQAYNNIVIFHVLASISIKMVISKKQTVQIVFLELAVDVLCQNPEGSKHIQPLPVLGKP
jgi:hypothetical protein